MHRLIKMIVVTLLSITLFSTLAYAGVWQNTGYGWKWFNDDGSNPVNTWQWCDGNHDGIGEAYYFDQNGYCLINTVTPDGFYVDSNGAWVVDGIVQTATVQTAGTDPSWIGTYKTEYDDTIVIDYQDANGVRITLTSASEEGWYTESYYVPFSNSKTEAIYNDPASIHTNIKYTRVNDSLIYLTTIRKSDGSNVGSFADGPYYRSN